MSGPLFVLEKSSREVGPQLALLLGMMKLEMSYELTLEQMMLTSPDAVTDSIFPLVEAWLQLDSDRMKALEWVASRKKAGKYRSVVDFLNAEVNTEWRKATLEYYLSNTLPLRLILDGQTRARLEGRMLVALEIAYRAFCDKRKLSWSALVASTIIVERIVS